MPHQSYNPREKWRPFRWIPILFVVSLLASVSVCYFVDERSHAGQRSDSPLSQGPEMATRLKESIPKGLVVSLVLTGIACSLFVAIKRLKKTSNTD